MADNNDKKLIPVYLDLDKLNIQQLEQKKIEDLERLNTIGAIEPSPMPTGSFKRDADEVNRKEWQIERQKIIRGIKEIEAEIARQKETAKLAKQFNKKFREDKEREKKDRGH